MSDQDKSRRVREMFGAIAGRYDFLNHFLSVNMDRHWRKICVREVRRRTSVPSPKILDLGCGTGDLSIAFSGMGAVTGCDFCHPMLRVCAGKAQACQLEAAGISARSGCPDASIRQGVVRRGGVGICIEEPGGH